MSDHRVQLEKGQPTQLRLLPLCDGCGCALPDADTRLDLCTGDELCEGCALQREMYLVSINSPIHLHGRY